MKSKHRTSNSGIKIATAQHSTAQHSTAQHSTAQHSTKKKHLLIPLFWALPLAAHAALQSQVTTVDCSVIEGWAYDDASPTTPLKLDIVDTTRSKAVKLATVTAKKPFPGQGSGYNGFVYVLPASIQTAAQHTFAIYYTGTNTNLNGSPNTTISACYGKLNDTGITACADGGKNNLACPVSGYPGQDAQYGRDSVKKLSKTGGGHAGFDFTKIANDGSKLPATAALGSGPKDWACTRDNVTGLIWEVKTADGGLRDQNQGYSWYNPDVKTNGGFAGYQNLGSCTGGISCDTDGYAQKINQLGLCGHQDWRLPKQAELKSIVDYSHVNPAIDSTYFPNTVSGWFWSSSPYAYYSDFVWIVSFYDGFDSYAARYGSFAVRLVRAGQ